MVRKRDPALPGPCRSRYRRSTGRRPTRSLAFPARIAEGSDRHCADKEIYRAEAPENEDQPAQHHKPDVVLLCDKAVRTLNTQPFVDVIGKERNKPI